MTQDPSSEQRVWADNDSQRFYREHRQSPTDLYPSERLFLPSLLPQVESCLDIGCAAGGFFRIMRSFNPALDYTGIDIIPAFVEAASLANPDGRFLVGDGITFDSPDGSYDLVHSSGVMHVNSRWSQILASGYAQARRYFLSDFRLTDGAGCRGTFRVDFEATGKNSDSVLPYIVLNLDQFLASVLALQPAPAAITLRGYPFPPSRTANLPLAEVLMVFALIEKGPAQGVTRISVEIAGREEGAP